ncbi:MAG: hypothetical protein AAB869_03800 [Patescibacteria group bacterium]
MMDYLDKLRAKPVHVRERISWIATATLSLLVGSVWFATWNPVTAVSLPAPSEISQPSPFRVVSDILGRMKEETMAALGKASDQLRRQTEGNIEYIPSKEIETAGSAVEDVTAGTIITSTIPANVSDERTTDDVLNNSNTLGEAIHTRPRSLSDNDVVR